MNYTVCESRSEDTMASGLSPPSSSRRRAETGFGLEGFASRSCVNLIRCTRNHPIPPGSAIAFRSLLKCISLPWQRCQILSNSIANRWYSPLPCSVESKRQTGASSRWFPAHGTESRRCGWGKSSGRRRILSGCYATDLRRLEGRHGLRHDQMCGRFRWSHSRAGP
jgi:hypothetical protein